MASNLAYVFDANVLVRTALLPGSTPRRAFDAARGQGAILLSDRLFDELQDVLARRKFDRYLSPGERAEFLSTLKRETTGVNITVSIQACRDPKDNHILELAVSDGATCIIRRASSRATATFWRSIPSRVSSSARRTLSSWRGNRQSHKPEPLVALRPHYPGGSTATSGYAA